MEDVIKRSFAVFAILSLVLTSCSAQPSPKEVLCGVWYKSPSPASDVLSTRDFSRGKGVTVINGAIEIDTFSQNPTIFLPGMGGPFQITQLSLEGENSFTLSFFFKRGNFQVDYKAHFDPEKGTLWFEDLKKSNFIESGPNHLWYKISGPDKK